VSKLFSFPNPANDTSARIVAAGVVTMAVVFIITGNGWVLVPLTYGFAARVASGPTLSPLGQLSVRVITPLIKVQHKLVPGPPKRFAQTIGLVFTAVASALYLADNLSAARIVMAMLVVAASLEAFLGYCLGCKMFAILMRLGVIPEEVCAECNDISLRIRNNAL
jgi:hypothetical protein